MLCDWQIIDLCKNTDVITPFDESLVQPCSLDIRLGSRACYYTDVSDYIDVHDPKTYTSVKCNFAQLIINPQEFVLASTLETLKLPHNIVATLTGRSSIGRLGIMIHVTAGLVDCAFHGRLTLELYNLNDRPIILYPGDVIGQLTFDKVDDPALSYNGRYQGDMDVNSSLFYK